MTKQRVCQEIPRKFPFSADSHKIEGLQALFLRKGHHAGNRNRTYGMDRTYGA
mgnify:CR=1 FL=1